jgi:hypothetical protein
MPTFNAAKLLAILALVSQVPYSLQQDDSAEEHHGHTHDLDPALFTDFAATDEPIGSIMTLHLVTMVISTYS